MRLTHIVTYVSPQGLPARNQLMRESLSDWASAPRPARADHDQFVRSVATSLLGGEAGVEEVAESALAAWRALDAAGPPEKLRGRGSALNLRPIR